MINQEPRASPKVASPAAMSLSMSPTTRSPAQVPREYKVLRTARAPSSASLSGIKPSAASRAPVPIPIPGQPLPATAGTRTGANASIDNNDTPTPSGFVLYEAVPAGVTEVEQTQESGPEMEEFQDLLKEYLRGKLDHAFCG